MLKLVRASLLILLTCAFVPIGSGCKERCDPPRDTPEVFVTQLNPAMGWSVVETGTEDDPFAAFGRIPLDPPRRIPEKGNYMDDERDGPHFGIDYTDPDSYLNSHTPKPVHPIGPGIITAVQPCLPCWADGDHPWGQKRSGEARYNFGFGAIVVIEHPYNEYVSFYTLYAHLREIQVHVGQRVDSEVILGLMGVSGDAAGPHVHFEVRYGLPGQFWGADFSHRRVMQRWIEMYYNTPLYLLMPEHHVPFTRVLNNWVEDVYPTLVRD